MEIISRNRFDYKIMFCEATITRWIKLSDDLSRVLGLRMDTTISCVFASN